MFIGLLLKGRYDEGIGFLHSFVRNGRYIRRKRSLFAGCGAFAFPVLMPLPVCDKRAKIR